MGKNSELIIRCSNITWSFRWFGKGYRSTTIQNFFPVSAEWIWYMVEIFGSFPSVVDMSRTNLDLFNNRYSSCTSTSVARCRNIFSGICSHTRIGEPRRDKGSVQPGPIDCQHRLLSRLLSRSRRRDRHLHTWNRNSCYTLGSTTKVSIWWKYTSHP